jgi:hypothetical protein
LWYEEAKLYSREFVDEEHGRMIGGVAFLDDIGWDDFPLAIFQVLPLIWAIFTDPETSLEYVAVVAAGLPGNTEPLLRGRIHLLLVKPFVMRHRRIVSISTKGKQKYTERRQYATERFHGSLRYGLSLISASANHTNSPALNQATFPEKWNPISEPSSLLGKTVVFLFDLKCPQRAFISIAPSTWWSTGKRIATELDVFASMLARAGEAIEQRHLLAQSGHVSRADGRSLPRKNSLGTNSLGHAVHRRLPTWSTPWKPSFPDNHVS